MVLNIKHNGAGFICKLFNGIISIVYFCYQINKSHFYFKILESQEFQIHSKTEVLIMKQICFIKDQKNIMESLKYFVKS